MRVARALATLLLGGGLALTAAPASAQGPTSAPRPNILLILADDLGHEVLGAYGGTSYRTPHLDRLAAGGALFQRAYSTPLCTPTRVQLMTGKYNFRNYERFAYLNPREPTFANHLRDAGYATAVVGKWQLGVDSQAPHTLGFDEYLLWQLNGPDFWTRYKDPAVTRSGGERTVLQGRYGPDVFAEFIENFMGRHRDQPFLVYYPMALVHDPFQPTPGHPEYDRFAIQGTNEPRYFGGMVEHMDGIVGRLIRRLEELGIRDNTLVLFVGDNGTDRDIVSRVGERVVRGDKGNTTDAGTHVPLIASWPAVVEPGQVRSELVDVVDIFPTLLHLAGVPASTEQVTDGITLAPTLTRGATHTRQWIFGDYDPRWGKFQPRRYAHDGRFKLYGDGSLFDFVADPLEQHPVRVESQQARRARAALQRVLDRFQAEKQRQAR